MRCFLKRNEMYIFSELKCCRKFLDKVCLSWKFKIKWCLHSPHPKCEKWYHLNKLNKLWIVNWKWLAMECSVNYTIVWWSFIIWPHEPSGELGSYSERTSDYDIIYRTLHGKPFSVNYRFYPIDCFWFLNSNLQCQNLLFISSAFTLVF